MALPGKGAGVGAGPSGKACLKLRKHDCPLPPKAALKTDMTLGPAPPPMPHSTSSKAPAPSWRLPTPHPLVPTFDWAHSGLSIPRASCV